MHNSLLAKLRAQYHKRICDSILGYRPHRGSLSLADSSSETSKTIAELMARNMGYPLCAEPKEGQTAGKLFADYTAAFVEEAFKLLARVRPGNWRFSTSQAEGIDAYDQYEHLGTLAEAAKGSIDLAALLGTGYLVTPDIIVARMPLSDAEINEEKPVVSEEPRVAAATPLRAGNFDNPRAILHASISCKWTMRSDRAQNTRTEALNLIRNRKGRTPHIVMVTMEPMATRIQSLASGTGDLDCAYHGALYELEEATKEYQGQHPRCEQLEALDQLIKGRRLRDISDLPLDLSI